MLNKAQRGVTLVEIMVVLVLSSILGIGLFVVFQSGHNVVASSVSGFRISQAASILREEMIQNVKNRTYSLRTIDYAGACWINDPCNPRVASPNILFFNAQNGPWIGYSVQNGVLVFSSGTSPADTLSFATTSPLDIFQDTLLVSNATPFSAHTNLASVTVNLGYIRFKSNPYDSILVPPFRIRNVRNSP